MSQQSTILQLLADNPEGLNGSELVKLSGGVLRTGTIYWRLERLVDKGLVSMLLDSPTSESVYGRARVFITGLGVIALNGESKV